MSKAEIKAITEIPIALDFDSLLADVHLVPSSEDAKIFESIFNQACEIAKPKAIYRVAYIESKHDASITIDGVEFTSRTLRVNLEKIERVFVYVATCGKEIDRMSLSDGDLLQDFWLDRIKVALLDCSLSYLRAYLDHKYHPGKMASISPGSGDANIWPIQQQKELFSLLGKIEELIGVRLTESFLMVPTKSVSGFLYPTEIDFQSCMLCHRERCSGRRAPFKKKLWDSIHQDRSF